jgi:hydroxymethylbilane synthase
VRQAEIALQALARAYPEESFRLRRVTSAGDRLRDVSLEEVDGQGFFTAALERVLLQGEADLAVHSLKDLPIELDDRFMIAAVLPRGDARDALVSRHGPLNALPPRARVGTDSSRRRSQLLLLRPDLVIAPVRGNIPTRLAKLDRGDYDAVVLAIAGLERLDLGGRATQLLPLDVCLPAPGQGAIALEAMAGSEWAQRAHAVNDPASAAAVAAERAFLAALGGGCRTPVGVHATVSGDRLRLDGVAIELGVAQRVSVEGSADRPATIGREAGLQVLSRGVAV